MNWLQQLLNSVALRFLNRDDPIRPQEDVQIVELKRAVRVHLDGLQHGEDIPVAIFHLAALIPVAAIFNVQRVQMIFRGQPVQLRILRV